MKKLIALVIILFLFLHTHAQNKSAYTWIIGGEGMFAKFSGDTTRPITGQRFNMGSPLYPYIFLNSQSQICDSATGVLLFMCNGMRIYDTSGLIMENGDSLQPDKIYSSGTYPARPNTNGSLILPKGSSGLYNVFTPTITDSNFTTYATSTIKFPYDLLQYHIVDMNANGGMGKVVQKNIELLAHKEINQTGMMACRHANGVDWWLLKQALDTNIVYTFLVTADTVELKLTQGFSFPKFGFYDLAGQSCFSSNGSKYAFASGGAGLQNTGAHIFISDFERCTGVLSNPKELTPPYDSTLTLIDTLFAPAKDSLISGLAFSANDSFLYVARRFNIYQYDLYEPDSSLVWYHVQYGPDTTFSQFVEYGQLQRGVDNRIYIGKWGGASYTPNSVIDYPNKKGAACGFCRHCLRCIGCPSSMSSPPTVPEFNLGKLEPCWPLAMNDLVKEQDRELEIYPNPAYAKVHIKYTLKVHEKAMLEVYTSVGQVVFNSEITFSNSSNFEIDISKFSRV